jgi:hypothetical protein
MGRNSRHHGKDLEPMNNATSRSSLVLGLAAVLGIMPAHVGAVEDPNLRHFGVIGFVTGQTLRLNVANVAASRTAACAVTLAFFDANGNVLKQASATVEAGQATFLDLSQLDIIDMGRRPQVRATLEVPPGPCAQRLVGSLELIDLTGKTTVFVEDPNERR